MIKVIIIEDEVYVRFILKSKLEEYCLEVEFLGMVDNFKEGWIFI